MTIRTNAPLDIPEAFWKPTASFFTGEGGEKRRQHLLNSNLLLSERKPRGYKDHEIVPVAIEAPFLGWSVPMLRVLQITPKRPRTWIVLSPLAIPALARWLRCMVHVHLLWQEDNSQWMEATRAMLTAPPAPWDCASFVGRRDEGVKFCLWKDFSIGEGDEKKPTAPVYDMELNSDYAGSLSCYLCNLYFMLTGKQAD